MLWCSATMATNARGGERDVRREVLEVATRLMAARGFDGTSLQDIAYEVGVSKPAVLHHYPSKEHIHQAVMQAILNHWRDTLPRVMLARALELAVFLDRATALEERGYEVRVRKVFGEQVSPRNLGIFGRR